MKSIFIIVLAICFSLFLFGLICKLFYKWTWKEYFKKVLDWIVTAITP